MRPILPARAKPYAFAASQAFVTTGVSTLIASGTASLRWLTSWALSWALLVPVVLVLAPLLWRILGHVCGPDPRQR